MKIMSSSKYSKAMAHVTVVMSQIDALAYDEEWQATLAAIREAHPNGCMHP